MKQKVLLGLFVSLPFVCTIPVFAAGNIPATEKRDIQISRYDEETVSRPCFTELEKSKR